MRKNREILDDERNLTRLENFHELVAMRMAAVQDGERSPLRPGPMQPLDFSGDPPSLGLAGCVRDDSHFVAVFANGRERVLGNIARFFIVSYALPPAAPNTA